MPYSEGKDVDKEFETIISKIKEVQGSEGAGFVLFFGVKTEQVDGKNVQNRTLQLAKKNVTLEQVLSSLEVAKHIELKNLNI